MNIFFGLIPHEVDLVTTVLVLAPVMIGLVAIGHWLAQLIVRTLPHILVEYRLRREVAKGKRPENPDQQWKHYETPAFMRHGRGNDGSSLS